MSRAGFSIRKLINQRRTWPDSDDDTEEAFECSSAKTIRVQYELEQYQQQQLLQDGRHHQSKDRISWISSNGDPRKKAHRRIPQPITISRHASDEVLLKSGSASRRISSPVPISSLVGRITPRTPLYSRSSEESLDDVDGKGYLQVQSQHHNVPRRSASALGDYHSPHLSTTNASGSTTTHAPPTTKKCSYEQPSLENDKVISLPSVCMSTSHQPTHTTEYVDAPHVNTLSGVCMSASHQPTYPTNHWNKSYIKTPVVTIDGTTRTSNISEHQKSNPIGNIQYPEFANGIPSPPLDREAAEGKNVVDPQGLSMGQPLTKPARDAETTWLLGDGDDDVVPDDVQQLIWETDEAYKAVSAMLAEVNQVSHSHPQAKELEAQLRQLQHTSQVLHTQTHGKKSTPQNIPTSTQAYPSVRDLVSPISPTSGRGTVASRKSSSPLSPSPNILRSPTRGTSIAKTKRVPKSPGRPKTPRSASYDLSPAKLGPSGPSSKSLNSHRYHHSYHRSLSKLNLAADNVTDKLFNGSRGRFGLHRIEADEIVRPSQIQQFREARIAKESAEAEAEVEARASSSSEILRSIGEIYSEIDSSNGTTSDNTPIEPFDLQDLPSRIGNSGVNATANVLSPVVEVPTPKSFEFNKDNTQQALFMGEPMKQAHLTKGPEQGQTLIVTPPPTPPQAPSHATFNTDTASQTLVLDDDESMSLLSLGLQRLLPSKSSRKPTHTRANSSSSRIPILPTIPEVKITAPQTGETPRRSHSQGRDTPEQTDENPAVPTERCANPFFHEDDDHMWLVSPAYTQNMPTIQHGPIRLAKDDLVNHGAINSIEAKLMTSPDETMDWIAFQMAILGGAGDLNSNPDDFLTRDAQEDLVDDLCEWFEDFGLPTNALGCLMTKEEKPKPTFTPLTPHAPTPKASPRTPQSVRTKRSGSSRSQLQRDVSTSSKAVLSPKDVVEGGELDESQNMPIPVTTEHPSGFWNTRPFDASRFFTGSGCGIKRWTLEGHPKRYQGPGIDVDKANTLPGSSPKPLHSAKSVHKRGIRESIDSLPQSPMLDLVMTTGVDGSKDFVPMGYNLGHDLGDFLKWESEHVYASGFYGSD